MSSSSSNPSHSPSAVPGGGVGGSVAGGRMNGEVARPKAGALEGLAIIETGNRRWRPSRRACVPGDLGGQGPESPSEDY